MQPIGVKHRHLYKLTSQFLTYSVRGRRLCTHFLFHSPFSAAVWSQNLCLHFQTLKLALGDRQGKLTCIIKTSASVGRSRTSCTKGENAERRRVRDIGRTLILETKVCVLLETKRHQPFPKPNDVILVT